jgi:hypothetical protein
MRLADVCKMDGSYKLRANVVCRPLRAASCPVDGATNIAEFTFTLLSPNMCPGVVQTLDLTSQLNVYANDERSLAKDDFVDPQVLYFEAPTTSGQASIDYTEIVDVRVLRPGGAVVTLFDRSLAATGAITAKGVATSFARSRGGPVDFGQPSRPRFRFTLVASALGLVQDAIETVIVQAVVSVRYENAGQPQLLSTISSWELQASSVVTEGVSGSARVVVRSAPGGTRPPTPGGPDSESSASGSSPLGMGVIAGVAAAVALVALVAVVVIVRKRNQRAAALGAAGGDATMMSLAPSVEVDDALTSSVSPVERRPPPPSSTNLRESTGATSGSDEGEADASDADDDNVEYAVSTGDVVVTGMRPSRDVRSVADLYASIIDDTAAAAAVESTEGDSSKPPAPVDREGVEQ